MKKLLILCFSLASAVVSAQQQEINSVSVNGEGVVRVVPDGVLIRARIEHEGNSPSEVKDENDEVVDRILKYLRAQGVPDGNVQTEYLNLNKIYDYNTKAYSYTANQAISIELEDLQKYEQIMSGLLESGLNRIDGVLFKTSRRSELQSEARKNAVLNAKDKASELAQALNQEIGMAIKINEQQRDDYGPVYRTMEMKADSSGSEETLAPGEIEIKAVVNVVFHLRNGNPGNRE